MEDARRANQREEPALKVEFTQILQDMIGDLSNAPEPVHINLFSQSPEELSHVAPPGRRRDLRKVQGRR